MAVITPSTFDPLKTRCAVRLQQGVPIVDADWNELDDIRKFEMRAYLKWFVGDGIPDGSDGFRIDAVGGVADDFIIRVGVPAAVGSPGVVEVGLRNTGRCIVDGLDVIIAADVRYKLQSAPVGATPIAAIPVLNGAVTVYLDVWERLVTSQEEPGLVLAGIGTESCARVKREWCVRTRAGATVPVSPEPEFVAGHAYYALCTINRKLSAPNVPANIDAADLTDRRHRGMTLSAMEMRLARMEKLLLFPVFTQVNPLVPKAGAVGAQITLSGRNFDIGTPVVTVGGLPATLVPPVTAAQIKATVPNLVAGTYPVTVSNDGGGPVTCPDPFTVVVGGGGGGGGGGQPAPTFRVVNPIIPLSAKAGATINVFGDHFDVSNLKVSFNVTAAVLQSSNATQITLTVPAVVSGAYTINVSTDGGTVGSPVQFNVVP